MENTQPEVTTSGLVTLSTPVEELGKANGHSQVKEPGKPRGYRLTQFGNVERMIDRYGHNIKWCKAFGFIVWDGKRWVIDQDTLVERYAWDTVRSIYSDASEFLHLASLCSDTGENEKSKELASKGETLAKWGKASENRTMVSDMIKLVRHKVMIDPQVLDSHITSMYKLNFQNGTLDMTPDKWKFYKHRREDYLTRILTFDYNPHETKDAGYLFDAFLDDITCGNKELARYIQKALGLSLTAYTKEEAWFLLLGQGENGKTTLFDLIAYIMGEYAVRVDEKTIAVSNTSRGGSVASPDIARLKGKRLAIVAETEEGALLATSRLKDMATGEQVTARYLNHDNFEFYQTHKIFIYTNHLPQVRDTSHGFWRRVSLIPFDYTVPPEKKDRNLIFKLREEAVHVLAWMIEGERLRQVEGMERPEIIQRATGHYRESQDVIGQFIQEYCIVDTQAWVGASVLQMKFRAWLEDEMGMKPFTTQALKRMMLDHGVGYKRTETGNRYTGLRLRTETDALPSEDVGHDRMDVGHESTVNPPVERAQAQQMYDMYDKTGSSLVNGFPREQPVNVVHPLHDSSQLALQAGLQHVGHFSPLHPHTSLPGSQEEPIEFGGVDPPPRRCSTCGASEFAIIGGKEHTNAPYQCKKCGTMNAGRWKQRV